MPLLPTLLLLALPLSAATPPTPQQFPIIAWSPSPSDPAALQLMKDAGLNVSGFCRPEDLDKVRAAGLSCIVSRHPLEALINKPETSEAALGEAAAALAKRLNNHPAAFAIHLRDEPSTALYPMLGRITRAIRAAMPNQLPYINLFPNYANAQQLAAPSYETYLREYLRQVRTPYLSWDNYSLTNGEMQQSFYDNLALVRQLTLEAKIPFWNCILSTALFRYMEPSDATFNIQVYGTLAYGGRGIQYFTYFAHDNGNFRLAPIDHYGNRTATWDALRRINHQLHALIPTLVQLRSTGVYHWPLSTPDGTPLIKDIRTAQKLLIGEFADTSGRPYVMLVNKSLQESTSFRLEPATAGVSLRRISPVTGQERPLDGESNWLAPGAGILLRLAPPATN